MRSEVPFTDLRAMTGEVRADIYEAWETPNQFIDGRLVLYTRAESWKISPGNNRSIEQTGKPIYLFVQYHEGLCQRLSVGR